MLQLLLLLLLFKKDGFGSKTTFIIAVPDYIWFLLYLKRRAYNIWDKLMFIWLSFRLNNHFDIVILMVPQRLLTNRCNVLILFKIMNELRVSKTWFKHNVMNQLSPEETMKVSFIIIEPNGSSTWSLLNGFELIN